jgi:hypothetical protein
LLFGTLSAPSWLTALGAVAFVVWLIYRACAGIGEWRDGLKAKRAKRAHLAEDAARTENSLRANRTAHAEWIATQAEFVAKAEQSADEETQRLYLAHAHGPCAREIEAAAVRVGVPNELLRQACLDDFRQPLLFLRLSILKTPSAVA